MFATLQFSVSANQDRQYASRTFVNQKMFFPSDFMRLRANVAARPRLMMLRSFLLDSSSTVLVDIQKWHGKLHPTCTACKTKREIESELKMKNAFRALFSGVYTCSGVQWLGTTCCLVHLCSPYIDEYLCRSFFFAFHTWMLHVTCSTLWLKCRKYYNMSVCIIRFCISVMEYSNS